MVGCFFVAPGLFKYLKFTPDALAQSLAFIPYWSLAYPGSIYPLLLPGWTLNYEMFFYALFAGVLFLPGRHRLVGLTMVLGLLVIAGYVFHPVSAISIIYTSPRLLEFAAGALLAHLWRAGQLQMRFEVAAAVLLLAACSVLVHGWAGTPEWTGSPAGDWIEMGLATCIVGACLHPTIVKTQNVTLGALGDASYSIYLTHLFTLGAMRVVWSHFVHTATVGSSIAWMAVSLVGCALAGWICFLGIERPITNGLKRWHPWARAKETYQRITVIREGN
jgi:exopolysaccharide production protein ExoZ